MTNERRHEPVFPGFREMSERRQALSDELVGLRRGLGLSQTQVAARMGTSQSAVARLETGTSDVLMSTVERYASALGRVWTGRSGMVRSDSDPLGPTGPFPLRRTGRLGGTGSAVVAGGRRGPGGVDAEEAVRPADRAALRPVGRRRSDMSSAPS